MAYKIKDFLEIFLFFFLSLLIYGLFILTIPIGQESHGWMALNGFDHPLWTDELNWFIYGSALVCCLLGTIMMSWVPILTPEVTRNLWTVTYFFIWIDTVFSLSAEYQTNEFYLELAAGLLFIFLFFRALRFFGYVPKGDTLTSDWKTQMVHYWNWGWMSFYCALSFLLIYNSFRYLDSRLALSLGAFVVCFLNYAFSLFIQKSEGKAIESYSRTARVVFSVWLIVILACVAGIKWFF